MLPSQRKMLFIQSSWRGQRGTSGMDESWAVASQGHVKDIAHSWTMSFQALQYKSQVTVLLYFAVFILLVLKDKKSGAVCLPELPQNNSLCLNQ